jgi:hypothetical protein
MTRTLKDQTENTRPHRAASTRAPRRVIDGYPAGYVAQLARPLAAAGRSAAERTTRARPAGLRLQTSAQAAE